MNKCFCHFNGYEVKDAYSRRKLDNINLINVKDYGVIGDGVNDDGIILNSILSDIVKDGSTVYFPEGTYLCNNKLIINGLNNVKFIFDGVINSNYGVEINSLVRCQFKNMKIERPYTKYEYNSMLNTGLHIENSKYCSFTDLYVAGFNKGIYWYGNGKSNSYNNLFNLHLFDNVNSWSMLNENDGFSNEISVFGGRFSINCGETDLSGIATYIDIPKNVSGNNFYGICLEGAFTKIKCNGSYNHFDSCRLEFQDSNKQDVIFGEDSANNTLSNCYMSEQSGGTVIVDNGNYNKIENSRNINFNKIIKNNVINIDSNYTLGKTYNCLLCDCTDNNIVITLPTNNDNFENANIRIRKIDNSDNGVSLFTSGQNSYDFVGRGIILKRIGDYVDLYFDGVKWCINEISNLYETSLPERNETNLIEGLIYQDGINQKIIVEGGTVSSVQITNTYANTTANSKEISLIINSSNRILRVGNYIKIEGESGYFKIVKLDLTNLSATLDRATTNTNSNVRITYHSGVKKYMGLIYDKVDSLPNTSGNIGDLVFYNTPVSGGYIGAIYTSNGWKNFGSIE